MGTVGTISQLIMTQAFREADATAVLPVDFTRLLWASLFGMLIFNESPELATLIGGTLIFVSTTYITYREARLARARPRRGASGAREPDAERQAPAADPISSREGPPSRSPSTTVRPVNVSPRRVAEVVRAGEAARPDLESQ